VRAVIVEEAWHNVEDEPVLDVVLDEEVVPGKAVVPDEEVVDALLVVETEDADVEMLAQ